MKLECNVEITRQEYNFYTARSGEYTLKSNKHTWLSVLQHVFSQLNVKDVNS